MSSLDWRWCHAWWGQRWGFARGRVWCGSSHLKAPCQAAIKALWGTWLCHQEQKGECKMNLFLFFCILNQVVSSGWDHGHFPAEQGEKKDKSHRWSLRIITPAAKKSIIEMRRLCQVKVPHIITGLSKHMTVKTRALVLSAPLCCHHFRVRWFAEELEQRPLIASCLPRSATFAARR